MIRGMSALDKAHHECTQNVKSPSGYYSDNWLIQLTTFSKLSVLLIVLLIVSSSIAALEYNQDAQVSAENQHLKKELSDTSQRLLTLQAQLNQTQEVVAKLQVHVANLEENITKLREQLRMAGSITVGLTFLWAEEAYFSDERRNVSDLQAIVQYMNDVQWADTGIYFFIRHARPENFMEGSEVCADVCGGNAECLMQGWGSRFENWAPQAWNLYPENDIPVGIFDSVSVFPQLFGEYFGCEAESKERPIKVVAMVLNFTEHRVVLNQSESTVLTSVWEVNVVPSAMTLTHELLHVFGFSDEELKAKKMYYPYYALPNEWIPRIQAAAKAFESAPATT
jgi:hypothetical protein